MNIYRIQIKKGVVAEGSYCLDFYYHMHGHHIGVLTISTINIGKVIFEKVGFPEYGLQKKWHHARSNVVLTRNDGVRFI